MDGWLVVPSHVKSGRPITQTQHKNNKYTNPGTHHHVEDAVHDHLREGTLGKEGEARLVDAHVVLLVLLDHRGGLGKQQEDLVSGLRWIEGY